MLEAGGVEREETMRDYYKIFTDMVKQMDEYIPGEYDAPPSVTSDPGNFYVAATINDYNELELPIWEKHKFAERVDLALKHFGVDLYEDAKSIYGFLEYLAFGDVYGIEERSMA
jgi:hypothetical protein